jgi:glutaryl-CoA dehydrogenase (non-decarboxylating)
MDFKLSEELQALRETARDFAEKEIVPFVEKWEEQHYFPREVIKKMADLGFYGTLVPEEYGGNGMGFLAGTIVTEEVARASASLRVTLNMQTFGPALSILRYGSEEQKKKYLPKLTSTEMISCFAITEPNAGSDIMSMKTTAIPKGDYFLVNGSKTWISISRGSPPGP